MVVNLQPSACPGDVCMESTKHQLASLVLDDDVHAAADQLDDLSISKSVSVLPSKDLAGVAHLIRSGAASKVVVMVGAGISTAAGIPDFRTPGTGLYSQLQRFDLPYPEAVFSLGFFRANPKPFYLLAKELFPGSYQPTPTHHLLHLLHRKGVLLRVFTQNIDGLEQQAGLPADKVVTAHGSFDGAHCADCKRRACMYALQEAVLEERVLLCSTCGGPVKPDIVFFGEALPARFHMQRLADLPQADLLLVMGTSLAVQPFAGMVGQVPEGIPRVLINKHAVGCSSSSSSASDDDVDHDSADLDQEDSKSQSSDGGDSRFDFEDGSRDVLHLGDCDAAARQLAELLGWRDELQQLMADAEAAAAAAAAEQEDDLL